MLNILAQRQLQLVFTYAPAGLGHLRVSDALYHGLPEAINPSVLGSRDRSIQVIHRITSIHPLARKAFEWLQSGPLSLSSNRLYRTLLRSDTDLVYEEMLRLIDGKFEPPQQILVVSTHFGLAHKLATIKERLQKEIHVRMSLVVVVTDDTFQPIWYVDGADLIVVPSHQAKEAYMAYGKQFGSRERIEVLPYPINQRLDQSLPAKAITTKNRQLDSESTEPIRVSIPISGAAVGTDYSLGIIEGLRARSERFIFHIVTKDAPYTKGFLAKINGKQWIDVHAAGVDRKVVDAYDSLFEKYIIALEITKPSEQSFKALLGTRSRGGVILLFSEPVGKQEFDNMDFLERHFLVPSQYTNAALWAMAEKNAGIQDVAEARIFDQAHTWRGVRLPTYPQQAANFIWWMIETGIFSRMMAGSAEPRSGNGHPDELGSDGVARFWKLVASV
ncbi:MAG: hypothetical protein JXB07_18055 [Anaerolineae bacterium]|nr:hypothetical protein [Anaerolineae bacterium]